MSCTAVKNTNDKESNNSTNSDKVYRDFLAGTEGFRLSMDPTLEEILIAEMRDGAVENKAKMMPPAMTSGCKFVVPLAPEEDHLQCVQELRGLQQIRTRLDVFGYI